MTVEKASEKKSEKKGASKDSEKQVAEGDEESKKTEDPEKKKKKRQQTNREPRKPRVFKNKYLEYHHGDWKRGQERVFVTMDTVIPTVPKKLQEKPDEAAFTKS